MTRTPGFQSSYTASGPWDRVGTALRIGFAVAFLAITVVFVTTAQDGLVSASNLGHAVAAPAPTK